MSGKLKYLTFLCGTLLARMPPVGPNAHLANTQTRVEVLNATFPWWLSTCKISRRLIDSLQRYWWSRFSTIWLDKRNNWPHPTKSGSLKCYLSLMPNLMQKKLRYNLIPSRDIDHQTILQYDWTRDIIDKLNQKR